MKSAFVTTVYNDEIGISILLNSILTQTIQPDEIIIVDAGSKDKTHEVIMSFKKRFGEKLKFFYKVGNRSNGRNFAIKNAKASIIAVSDSGCILKNDWFEKITSPLQERQVDVVAGYYQPLTQSIFQKSLATYTCVMPDRVTDDFLPSSRSVAFFKSAWEKVGGYPEELDTCEDLVFANKLKKEGFKFKVVKSAIVYWPQRKNITEAFNQFFSYAQGDGRALYFRKGTPFLYIRYFIGIILLALILIFNSPLFIWLIILMLIAYFCWAIWKNFKYVRSIKAFYYLPLLQLTSDLAVLLGTTLGLYRRIFNLRFNLLVL